MKVWICSVGLHLNRYTPIKAFTPVCNKPRRCYCLAERQVSQPWLSDITEQQKLVGGNQLNHLILSKGDAQKLHLSGNQTNCTKCQETPRNLLLPLASASNIQ